MKSTILKLATLAIATVFAIGLQAQERAATSRDLYGYQTYVSPRPGYCEFDYVPMDDASPVMLVPGDPDAAVDDRAAVVPLQQPFELYQLPTTALVVSGNGYLAMAGSFDEEDGADFSNDCPLPAIADNAAAVQDRIYVYHDDLRPQPGAQVRHAYFGTCPRQSETGATEACTVIEWDGFERVQPVASTQPLRMQAVLYHGSHQVALQYDSLDDSGGAQATIGLQGFEAQAARSASCNQAQRIAAQQSVCFFDPRYKQRSVVPGTVLP